MYCTYASTASKDTAGRNYNLYAISSDWNEMTITWESQPTYGEYIADVHAKKDQWLEVDVTDYVKEHIGETVSFVIYNETVDSTYGHVNFASRKSENGPQLVFEGTFTLD